MNGALDLPVPTVFVVCQGFQPLLGNAVNILGIFDRLTIPRPPDSDQPPTIQLNVLTLWTGGHGNFQQVLRVEDEDGGLVIEGSTPFRLDGSSARHIITLRVPIPAREGVCTIIVGRPDTDLLRQDFTVAFEPAPDPAT